MAQDIDLDQEFERTKEAQDFFEDFPSFLREAPAVTLHQSSSVTAEPLNLSLGKLKSSKKPADGASSSKPFTGVPTPVCKSEVLFADTQSPVHVYQHNKIIQKTKYCHVCSTNLSRIPDVQTSLLENAIPDYILAQYLHVGPINLRLQDVQISTTIYTRDPISTYLPKTIYSHTAHFANLLITLIILSAILTVRSTIAKSRIISRKNKTLLRTFPC